MCYCLSVLDVLVHLHGYNINMDVSAYFCIRERKTTFMIIIDYKDTRPIYEQIVEKMQTLILKGVLPNDSKLPSVRNLAIELSINPNTIQKAYAELERRGFLYTVKGRGNFVHYQDVLLNEKKAQLADKIKQIIREAEELGIKKEELFMAVDER